jgi:16S rRNA (cytosine1402-N4)-methyltransferase
MLAEVLEFLNPRDGGIYVDGTFGAGGYSRAILEAADCVVVAIDRDETAQAAAQKLSAQFGKRFVFVQGCFGDVENLLTKAGFEAVDGFVLDLGVSSMQIDEAERGFSFRFDGPLDMRMGQNSNDQSAADLVNTLPESELAHIIYTLGEERLSRRVARAIVARRAEMQFSRTLDLADVIRSVLPKNPKDKSDPATRTFQALRIAVNDELGELSRALDAAGSILKGGGRLVVVTFHSLEDRMVKDFMRQQVGRVPSASRYQPVAEIAQESGFDDLTRRAIHASSEEIKINPRSRSAKLRAIEKKSNQVGAV